ncbi:MAG: K(+)-stimulated pyrophosphate-energized sodium pump, partial [Acidimicrobiaceae bacterium]|nr:K(+)-stimulated pyrophosphate-energized sodium pump [Acidimicrobiaceae bacterium]
MTSVLAKEGGYQVFQLHGGEWLVLILSAVSALVAIAVGFYLARDVLSRDAGTPKMQEIARAIQEGASAYLRRQFKTILVILVPLAVVVFVTSVAVKKPGTTGDALSFFASGTARTLAFILGAF